MRTLAISDCKITEYASGISGLPDYPSDEGYTAAQLKALFDARSDNEIKEKHNALVAEVERLEGEKEELGAEIEGQGERLGKEEQSMTELEGRMQTAEGDIEALEGRMQAAERNLTETKEYIDKQDDILFGQVGSVQMQANVLENNLSGVRMQIEDVNNNIDVLRENIQDVRNEVEAEKYELWYEDTLTEDVSEFRINTKSNGSLFTGFKKLRVEIFGKITPNVTTGLRGKFTNNSLISDSIFLWGGNITYTYTDDTVGYGWHAEFERVSDNMFLSCASQKFMDNRSADSNLALMHKLLYQKAKPADFLFNLTTFYLYFSTADAYFLAGTNIKIWGVM